MSENTVLYRKYRSKSFSEVVGQSNTVEILKKSILKNRVSHAYLFTGPRGTGKTTLARLMAKAVNCDNFLSLGDVCNECPNCKAINEYSAVDIIEMDAASNRGIEEIRMLKENVNFAPSFLKKKIYIIDEAHMLTKEAFNALLKTLEEPPEHVLFILATTESHKIPVTILSRVERFDLSLASREELITKLNYILSNESFKTEDGVLEIIYKKSGGSFRDSESILSKLISSNKDNFITKEEVYNALGILKEEDIDNLAKILMNRELEPAVKKYQELISKGYSSANILDNLLDKVHELVLDDIQHANKYLSLISFLINLKNILKDFVDKELIFKLELITYCTNQSLPIDTSHQQKNTDKPGNNVENTSKVNEDLKKENIEDIKKEENNLSYKEIVAQISKEQFPRLRQIILNSEVIINNGILVIKTPYKMNITFLNKNEIKDFITSALLNKNIKIDGIQILQTSDIILDAPKKEEKIEEKEPISPVVEQKAQTESEQKDNTDLVESLL